MPSSLVVLSNRGPASLASSQAGPTAQAAAGGLASTLSRALPDESLWVAAASSEQERGLPDAPLAHTTEAGRKIKVRLVKIPPDEYDAFYTRISNEVLWFCFHYLLEPFRGASFTHAYKEAFGVYIEVNRAFARVAVEEEAPAYMANDYHLALTPRELKRNLEKAGSRSPILFFLHTPFPDPGYLKLLPHSWVRELLSGMLAADQLGFHTRPWATSFTRSAVEVLGVEARGARLRHPWGTTRIVVRPVPVDSKRLLEEAEQARQRLDALRQRIGDRRLVLRVDRAEPAKNVTRGFEAFELLLERAPHWRGRVCFLALLNPTRTSVPGYREYLAACRARAEKVNEKYGSLDWQPVLLEVADDRPRALAALTSYDVLLVNPIMDGMNLVAKEGAVLNRANGVLVLSRNAGAFEELGPACLPVDPLDVEGQARALLEALEMDEEERKSRAELLKKLASRGSPSAWLSSQVRLALRAAREPTRDGPLRPG